MNKYETYLANKPKPIPKEFKPGQRVNILREDGTIRHLNCVVSGPVPSQAWGDIRVAALYFYSDGSRSPDCPQYTLELVNE